MSQTYAAMDARADFRFAALDPVAHPERYSGVRSRRIFGFLVDVAMILVLMTIAAIVISVLGVFTFGLGWLLFPLIWPVVAILYEVFTKGGPASATPGMRFMGIELRTSEGDRLNYPMALLHSLGFWFSVTLLSPFVLLVGLFTLRKQLLHDLVLGTAAIRSESERPQPDHGERRAIIAEIRARSAGKAKAGPPAAESQDFLYDEDGLSK